MSETTNKVAQVQEQVTPAVDAAAAQAALEKAAQDAAEQEEKARAAALGILKAAGKAFRKGEKEYRAGLFEAGRLSADYVAARLALGDTRENATDTVRLELQQYSSGAVDVNELIACYQSFRLLAEEQSVKADVPYGHYKNGWRQLVQRESKATKEERWTLLPGMEEKARAAFSHAVKNNLSRDAVAEQCRNLQREFADAQKAEKEKAARAAREEQEKAKKEREEQDKRVREQETAARLAKEQADQAKDEERAALTKKAEEERAKLLAEQKAQAEKVEREAQAARDRAKKEQEEKAAQKVAQKAEDKTKTAEEKKAEREQKRAGNLLPSGTAKVKDRATDATPEQWAEMLCETLLEHPAPEDVLVSLLRRLKNKGELSKGGQSIIAGALLAADRVTKERSGAATARATAAPLVPSTNGVHVGAA